VLPSKPSTRAETGVRQNQRRRRPSRPNLRLAGVVPFASSPIHPNSSRGSLDAPSGARMTALDGATGHRCDQRRSAYESQSVAARRTVRGRRRLRAASEDRARASARCGDGSGTHQHYQPQSADDNHARDDDNAAGDDDNRSVDDNGTGIGAGRRARATSPGSGGHASSAGRAGTARRLPERHVHERRRARGLPPRSQPRRSTARRHGPMPRRDLQLVTASAGHVFGPRRRRPLAMSGADCPQRRPGQSSGSSSMPAQ
jgi:hypothetical protein